MSLFYRVINWILAVSEIFMCYCFVGLLDDREFIRKNKVYVSIWSMGIGSILAFNRSVTTLISWLMLLTQSFFALVSLMLQKRKNILLKFSIILISSICYAFLQFLGTFGIIILFPQIDIKQVYHMEEPAFFSCCFFALGVMYIFYKIIEKRIRKKTINLKPFCLSLYIFDIAGIGLIILFQRQLLIYEKNQSVDILFFIMMFIIVLVLTFIGSIKNAETKSELEILEFKDKMLEENYKEIHNVYQNYAFTYHDMKNHLIILDNYCKKGDLQKASKYIQKVREPLQSIKYYISIGNEVLDIILNYKLAEAEKRKIKVEVVSEKLNKTEIDENDLCAIFSNLIDNAIEACECMENGEKWIRILIRNMGEIMIFNISNSYIGEKEGIKKNIYGEIQSTQKGLHGYGLHSAKTKIEKYGGNLELSFENNIFNAMFTFYNIKKEGA